MPFAVGGNARIRTNIAAENAYNVLESVNKDISLIQLRLSTGKKVNNAADDVASYITSRALQSRNGALKAALNAVGDANNVAKRIVITKMTWNWSTGCDSISRSWSDLYVQGFYS